MDTNSPKDWLKGPGTQHLYMGTTEVDVAARL